MSENLKKILTFGGFIILVIGLAFALYYFFFRSGPAPAVLPTAKQPQAGGQLPTAGIGEGGTVVGEGEAGLPAITELPPEVVVSQVASGGLTEVKTLVLGSVVAPVYSAGGINYYNKDESRFYRLNPDGSKTYLSDKRFYSVDKITWAANGNKVVLEYPDGSNVIYDFALKQQYSLPKEMLSFAFTKDSGKLSAQVIGPSPETNWLITMNADGTNIKFVERLGEQADNVDMNWSPDEQIVALFRKNSGSNSQDIILIGQNDENFRALPVYGRGFKAQWTPNGQNLLYSVYQAENGFKPALWIASAKGDSIGLNNVALGLETWIDKCVISADSNTAYCGVPKSLPDGSGVYPGLAAGVGDDFYRINLKTGQKSLIANPIGDRGSYNAKQMYLSADGKTLYFQDAVSGGVYNLKLE